MDIRPLRNEADYDWAFAEIVPYFEQEPTRRTSAADRFDALAALIAEYEARHWPIEPPDPMAAIRVPMEQAGYTQADLGRLLGSRSRASEILARRRGLTMEQARRLHEAWRIPAEALIRPVRMVGGHEAGCGQARPAGCGASAPIDDKPNHIVQIELSRGRAAV